MCYSTVILAWIAAIAIAPAAPSITDSGSSSAPQRPPREAALESLLSERGTPEQLEAAIENARKNGVSAQTILEARFLYHVDRNEEEKIAAMVPEFLKLRDDFKPGESAIFGQKEDWLAVIEYAQAIAAIRKGDKLAFKTHITEAFWLSPQQATAFAPNVERLRLEEAMASVKIDFFMKLAPLGTGGDPVPLEKSMKGKKAMLFHFWSPESTECEASLPDFATTAELLASNGVAVVSLVPPGPVEFLTKAIAMIDPLKGKNAGEWFIDSTAAPLARDLRIKNLPAVVVVSDTGKILFNGDPADDGFWIALKKIDAHLVRPDAGKKQDEKTKK
ncbi:MAG: hypothetical protein WCS43_01690 [Verrucomicrobiota bacterium]